MKTNKIPVVLIAVLALGLTLQAKAGGELSGSVAMPGGYLVPGAQVELAGAQLADTLTTRSDEQGIYTFKDLPAGQYSLTVKLEGFKTILLEGLAVKAGKKARRDVRLAFAALIEEIVIFGEKKTGPVKKVKREKPADGSVRIMKITRPRLLKKAAPEYPAEAREKGIEEDIVISARIDEQGRLGGMKVTSGKNAALIAAAFQALEKWRYQPYTINDEPGSSEVSIKFMFKLKK